MKTQGRYFLLRDYRGGDDRWHLDAPLDAQGRELDPWQFKAGRRLDLEGVPVIRVSQPGRALDFTLMAFAIPLVGSRAASVFERMVSRQELQLIPAMVEGRPEPYFILNALEVIRCIDDARCEEVTFWDAGHGDPERIGEYRNVAGLKVDAARVGGADVFRPWGWTGVLLVSKRLKEALDAEGITGTRFIEA